MSGDDVIKGRGKAVQSAQGLKVCRHINHNGVRYLPLQIGPEVNGIGSQHHRAALGLHAHRLQPQGVSGQVMQGIPGYSASSPA